MQPDIVSAAVVMQRAAVGRKVSLEGFFMQRAGTAVPSTASPALPDPVPAT